MARIIVLDSGPLGLISNPAGTLGPRTAREWLAGLNACRDVRLILPEVTDYEVRRELLRAGKGQGLARLDLLAATLEYAALTTKVMRHAAELWAGARNAGRPTAGEKSLDIDVILAAQALLLPSPGDEIIVATTNPAHLSRYVNSRTWHDIV